MLRATVLVGLLAALLLLTGCERTTASWNMDETSGSRMLDGTGEHHGTLHDIGFATGPSGGAYRFNGTSSYVRVARSEDLDPGAGRFTYQASINTTAVPPVRTSDVLRKGLSTTQGGDYKMELFPVNGTARVRCVMRGSAGQATVGGGAGLQDGAWHHIICARDGDTLTLTIDGTVVKSTTAPIGIVNNAADLVIGAKSPEQDFYTGLIDDVRIDGDPRAAAAAAPAPPTVGSATADDVGQPGAELQVDHRPSSRILLNSAVVLGCSVVLWWMSRRVTTDTRQG